MSAHPPLEGLLEGNPLGPHASVRYVRERAGELLHMDVKKLGRIPDGGGHRFRGRGGGTPRARAGYDYVHQAVDDASRVAYASILPDERGTTCARFLRDAAAFFASHGVRIERLMTDNAKNYTDSRVFAAALADLGARHVRTRPFRPQTNGKSERFNRTMLDEWAYVREYASNVERVAALDPWIDHYDHQVGLRKATRPLKPEDRLCEHGGWRGGFSGPEDHPEEGHTYEPRDLAA